MNIFRLDEDPIICARYHCDRHLVKMPLEYFDLLMGLKHPLGEWVYESIDNYNWLRIMANEVCSEFFIRYGQVHWVAKPLARIEPVSKLPEIGATEQPFINEGVELLAKSVVENYRSIYQGPKRHLCTWSHRLPPPWFSLNKREGFIGTDKLYKELINGRR